MVWVYHQANHSENAVGYNVPIHWSAVSQTVCTGASSSVMWRLLGEGALSGLTDSTWGLGVELQSLAVWDCEPGSSFSWWESKLCGSVWSLSLGGSSSPESCGLWERGRVLGGELTELGGFCPSSTQSTGGVVSLDGSPLTFFSYWAMKSGSIRRISSSNSWRSFSVQLPIQSWNNFT